MTSLNVKPEENKYAYRNRITSYNVCYTKLLRIQQGKKPAVVSRGYGGSFVGSVGVVSEGYGLLLDATEARNNFV